MIVRSVARERRIASAARAQVAGDEREVGGLDRDVGAGADRQAEVGLRERGRVVDAVADHRDDAALGLQARGRRRPCRRQHLGDDLVDADLGGDGARRSSRCRRSAARAAGRAPAARRRPRREVGLTVSATTNTAAHRAVPGGERPRCGPRASAARARGVELGGQRAGSTRPAAPGGRRRTRVAVDDALDAEALAVGEGLDRRQRRRPRRGARRSPGRSGARRRPRARRRAAAPRRASTPSATATLDERSSARS